MYPGNVNDIENCDISALNPTLFYLLFLNLYRTISTWNKFDNQRRQILRRESINKLRLGNIPENRLTCYKQVYHVQEMYL